MTGAKYHQGSAQFFELIECKTFDELREKYRNISKNRDWKFAHWAFRGEADSCWQLQTSLERIVGPEKLKDARGIEFRITREFMRRAHRYLPDVPKDEILEWLALMQHHGAPTRLLDWTYSFEVALHVAAVRPLSEPRHGKRAIWAIDLDWARDKFEKMLPQNLRGTWKKLDDPKKLPKILAKERLGVLQVTPFRLNERISIQQGTFLMPGKVSVSFEENLNAMNLNETSIRPYVFKFVFPGGRECPEGREFLTEAIEHLRAINITETTLFPGLDGYARSLSAFAQLVTFNPDEFPRNADVFSLKKG